MITSICLWSTLAGFCQDIPARLDSLLTGLADNHFFNGSLLVSENGHIIYERSAGYLDRAAGILNTDTTHFNLASLSKPFTALAVLQLVQGGLVNLDTPCIRYLPDFPYPAVTVRQLLTHTSGLPPLERFEADYIRDHPDEILSGQKVYDRLVALRKPLLYTPGDQWGYNNFNYLVLALLVERVTRIPFPDYMRKHVFIPAGMKVTYIRTPDMPNTTRYTMPAMYFTERLNVDSLDHHRYYTYYNLEGIAGPGNVVSTLQDLWHFDNALRAGKLLRQALLDSAFTPVVLNNGEAYHQAGSTRSYGMGWSLYHNKTAPFTKFAFHDGHIVGLTTFLHHNMDQDQTIICYDNTDDPPLDLMISVSNILNGIPPRKIQWAQSLARVYGEAMVKGGIDSAATVFNQLKDDTTHYYVDEMELNRLGYDLLSASFPHHNDYALEVFKINTLLFPKSGNTYDSYAQVLADNGHKDEAIAMYRKSISLWPGNEDGKKALKRLLDERN